MTGDRIGVRRPDSFTSCRLQDRILNDGRFETIFHTLSKCSRDDDAGFVSRNRCQNVLDTYSN